MAGRHLGGRVAGHSGLNTQHRQQDHSASVTLFSEDVTANFEVRKPGEGHHGRATAFDNPDSLSLLPFPALTWGVSSNPVCEGNAGFQAERLFTPLLPLHTLQLHLETIQELIGKWPLVSGTVPITLYVEWPGELGLCEGKERFRDEYPT